MALFPKGTRVALLVLGLCCMLPMSASAKAALFGDPYFETIGAETDLPDQNVTVVAQDQQGFIWVGMPSGFFRYDGYRFMRVAGGAAGLRLASAFVRAILVARDGRLWIGTDADGLFAFDPKLGSIQQFKHDADDEGSLSHDSVMSLAEDPEGGIWIGTRMGLDHFSKDPSRIDHLRGGALDELAGKDRRVLALLCDASGDLWIGTWNGLIRRDGLSGVIENVQVDNPNGESLRGKLVLSLSLLRGGYIGVGTARDGAFLLETAVARLTRISPDAEADWRAGDPMVLAMLQPNERELWIAGYGGIVVASALDGRVIRFLQRDVAVPSSLAHSQVRTMMLDTAGAIWIGGYGGGLQRHDPNNQAVRVLHHSPARPGSLSSPNVSSVVELDSGEIWIGTRDKGIDILDRKRGVVDSIRARQEGGNFLESDSVSAFAQTPDGSVWVGTVFGLHRFDPETRKPISIELPIALKNATIRRLLSARDGGLWIGSNFGLAHWQASTDSIHVISTVAGDSVSGDVNALALHADGRLWVGTGAAGLYSLDPGADQLQHMSLLTEAGTSISPSILGLLVSRDGQLWFDTSDGLMRLQERQSTQAVVVNVSATLGIGGRPFGANLLEDAQGRIWTQNFVYDRNRERVHELLPADGADLGTPWYRAYTQTRDGLMLYGGSKGLMVVDPAEFKPWSAPAPLRFSELQLDGALLATADWADGIDISPGKRSFGAEFAALDFSVPGRTRYAYRLEGYDTDWISQTADRRSISYGNLPPGEYTLHVRASSRNDIAASNELMLPVRVHAAWWQTAGFKVLLALLMMSLVFIGFRLRTASLRQRARELESTVARRTQELSVAKVRAEKTLEELRGAQRQLVAAEKMASLGGLVAGVAHEINTPLGVGVTAASHLDEALQRLEAKLSSADISPADLSQFSRMARQCTDMIMRNLDRADKLVRSFKQVAVDQSSEHRRVVKLADCLRDIVTALQPVLKRTPHRLLVDCPESIEMTTYPGAIQQVMTNLIMNSLTHGFDAQTRAPGEISISAALIESSSEAGRSVRLRYRDNGKGMSVEVAAKVFEPFFTTRRGSGGTGLGMHISFNLVTQVLKGSITCESTPGQGVYFEMLLPLVVADATL